MSAKNIILIILVGIIVAAIVLFSIQENQKPKEKIDLKLRLKVGQHHEMKLTNVYEVVQTYKDKMAKYNSKTDQVVGLDVGAVDTNGTMNIVFYYKSVALDANVSGRTIKYDSTKPPVETNDIYIKAISDVTAAVIASKFSVKVSPTGDRGEIKGFEAVLKKMEPKIKKEIIEEINDPNFNEKTLTVIAKKMLDNEVNARISFYKHFLGSIESDTKEMLGNIFIKYPCRTVTAGNKWYDKTQLNIYSMPVDANLTYILKGKENDIVYVDSISDVDMHKKLKVVEVNAREKISKYISGVHLAKNSLDFNTGLLRKSEAMIKFTGLQYVETDKTALSNFSANLKSVRPNMNIPITISGSAIIEMIK
ncbi:MAG: DUF6263 family protein [Planctomycetaceae bacterium]|nr:DUF6263 family protein [Planctomycetaceae bacterium]